MRGTGSPEIRIAADPPALFRAAADIFVRAAAESVARKGSFHVALSGGSTPKGLYELLAGDAALRSRIPWAKAFFFWSDERPVPPDHPDSNYRMAAEAMLSKVPISDGHVFRINGECVDSAAAAEQYEEILRRFFHLADGRLPRFDLMLLGMGPDGHTASLFPGSPALRERRRLVVANWVEKLGARRITMTAPALNGAAQLVFLVRGPDKAAALKAALEGPRDGTQVPAQLIRPCDGHVVWLVDRSAGRLLASPVNRSHP